jgi:demethoxyubiquinone hydroxylase (CLK1/Coq7/Cat5 family)
MHSLAVAHAPSEGRTGELEVLRNELRPLHAASGFVIGAMVSGLLWAMIALACSLAI